MNLLPPAMADREISQFCPLPTVHTFAPHLSERHYGKFSELPKRDGKHIVCPFYRWDRLFSEGYTTKKHTKGGKNRIQF